MRKEIRAIEVEGVRIEIEVVTAVKDVFDWLEQYIYNLNENVDFDPSDEAFEIVYKNGKTDYIGSDYDGHKISKRNIKSIVYSNPEDYIVYGDYEVNEYGIVSAV